MNLKFGVLIEYVSYFVNIEGLSTNKDMREAYWWDI